MRKWNLAGLVAFTAFLVFNTVIWYNSQGFSSSLLFPVPVVMGILILGLDRWAGENRIGVFAMSAFWTLYWGFFAYGAFLMAALYAWGYGLGDSMTAKLYLFAYFGFMVIFSVLCLANLIRFFVKLFSLPKLGNN